MIFRLGIITGCVGAVALFALGVTACFRHGPTQAEFYVYSGFACIIGSALCELLRRQPSEAGTSDTPR
jgi:sugar phosphate permease